MEYKKELQYIEQVYSKVKAGFFSYNFRKNFKNTVVFIDVDTGVIPKFHPREMREILTGTIHKKNGEVLLKVSYILPKNKHNGENRETN